ncbi:hypothetical protein D3C73_934490 [compost metagenome]
MFCPQVNLKLPYDNHFESTNQFSLLKFHLKPNDGFLEYEFSNPLDEVPSKRYENSATYFLS